MGPKVRIWTIDTVLAVIGTLAVVLSVVINEQSVKSRNQQIEVLLEEQTTNRHKLVQVEDVRRDALRLRDLNTLYSVLPALARDGDRMNRISNEGIKAYELALITMAQLDESDDFDATAFRIEALAGEALTGDLAARAGLNSEFVRLYGKIGSMYNDLRARQVEVSQITRVLRSEASRLSTISTYLQVFGIILVMIATIISLKRLEILYRREHMGEGAE